MKLLLLTILFSPVFIFAQQKAESLEDAIWLCDMASDTSIRDPDAAIEYLNAAGYWFNKNPNSPEKARYYSLVGYAYNYKGNRDSTGKYFELASLAAYQLNDIEWAIDMQSKYVMTHLLPTGQFDKALDLGLNIKELTKDVDDLEIQFRANRLLIDVYWDLEDFYEDFLELAIECNELAYEIGDEYYIKTSLFDLASAYGRNDKPNLAIDTYKEAAKLQLASEDYFVSASYNNMAIQFKVMEQYDSALFYYALGEKYSILQGRREGVAASKLYQGEVYVTQGRYQLGLESCLEAFETLKDLNVVRRQEDCTACIVNAYEGLGKKNLAFDYLLLDMALRDSLLSKGEEKELKLISNDFKYRIQSVTDSIDFAYKHEIKEAEIDQQKKRSYWLYGVLALTLLFAFFILNRFRITRRQKAIIEDQKVEVEKAHEELTEKNQEILDSINYAKRIQSAILPQDSLVKDKLPNSFVLYKPKDIVAGDFYWMEEKDGHLLVAAADCTGHGVPGAMVSVVCNNGLNRSVREHGLTDPGEILDMTRKIVIQEFEKSTEDVKDGMDIALCSIKQSSKDAEEALLKYAGAHNPLWVIRKGADLIEEIAADKQPIGKFLNPTPYVTKEVILRKGDTVYIFTDGYVDQFGGEKGKKFKASNFKSLLLQVHDLPLETQKARIDKVFEEWKGMLEQLDDVCVIGFRI